MLKEILEKENQEDVQKLWDDFDKEYNKFTKALRKVGVDRMVMSEMDDLEYEMFELLGVKA